MFKSFPKKSFDLGNSCLVVLVAFGVQILFQAVILLCGLSDAAATWTIVVGNQLLIFGVCFAFSLWQKVDLPEVMGLRRPPKWYFFPLFILIAICCVWAFAPISGLFSRLLTKLGYEYHPNYYVSMDNPGLFTIGFLALTILPAIGEETAIRGVLLTGGKRRSALFAILFTALIFALMHGNLRQLVHQFLIGAVMGYLAYLTGGIYASAVVHFTNNGVALLMEYGFKNGMIDPRAYWYINGELSAKTTVVGVAVGFFALVMLLMLVTILLHREKSKKEDFEPADGSIVKRISAYLDYLSPAPKANGEEENGYTKRFSLLMAIVLAVTFAAVVLLSFFTGGNA